MNEKSAESGPKRCRLRNHNKASTKVCEPGAQSHAKTWSGSSNRCGGRGFTTSKVNIS